MLAPWKRTVLTVGLVVFLGAGLAAAAEDPKIVSQEEPRDYLLLGFQLSPAASGLVNAWLISEGGDFSLFGPLLGGYEIGMFHRATAEQLEYRFKTFFNFKFELLRGHSVGAYVGAGGGLIEILRTRPQEAGLKFAVGFQGIVGLRIGPPFKDKFILELQVLNSNETDGGVRIHLLAGARF
jgi:hypothetical protein